MKLLCTIMASVDIGLIATGTAANSSAQNRPENDLTAANADAEGIKRQKLLKAMFYCATTIAGLSLLAIVVGIAAFLTSGFDFPYRLGGSAIAGVMALVFTIFPCCLYCEEKKTKTGTKMSSTFKHCLIGLIVMFGVSMCVILVVMGISGIWGVVECLKVKQNPESDIFSSCEDQTGAKFAFSILSLILPSLLLILSTVIICIYINNTKTFDYKTVQQRNYEYERTHVREELEHLERNNEPRHQRGEFNGVSDGPHGATGNRFDNYIRNNGRNSATLKDFESNYGDKKVYYNRDTGRLIEPSAPLLDVAGDNREPSAPPLDVAGDNTDEMPFHPRGPNLESEQDTEEPPPSYDEVVHKYL